MIYICWSYHHILIAISKVMSQNVHADILLVKNGNALDENIYIKLRNEKIFNNVYIIDSNKAPWGISKKRVLKYLINRYYRLKKYYDGCFPVNLKEYSNIYTFFDSDSIGAYLNILHLKYHIIEDAKRAYTTSVLKRLSPVITNQIINPSFIMSLAQKLNIIIPIFGNSKYCIDIEVDSLEDIYYTKYNKNKFICIEEKTVFDKLNMYNINIIMGIFGQELKLDKNKKYNLILTEPLYADKRVKDMYQQSKVYESIVEQITDDSIILIKPHPRDLCKYERIENDKIIKLSRTFPSEILTFVSNEMFENCYTISSSSILMFEEKKRIVYGNDFISKVLGNE